MLLVESLIYALIASRALSLQEAAAAVEVARDAQVALLDAGASGETTTHLLDAVLNSMRNDLPDAERER